eukprot:m.56654 g.56654  ORF g.56654 m.56654 type:complete len:382 (-) comp15591_c0_seq5:199-1344(-)
MQWLTFPTEVNATGVFCPPRLTLAMKYNRLYTLTSSFFPETQTMIPRSSMTSTCVKRRRDTSGYTLPSPSTPVRSSSSSPFFVPTSKFMPQKAAHKISELNARLNLRISGIWRNPPSPRFCTTASPMPACGPAPGVAGVGTPPAAGDVGPGCCCWRRAWCCSYWSRLSTSARLDTDVGRLCPRTAPSLASPVAVSSPGMTGESGAPPTTGEPGQPSGPATAVGFLAFAELGVEAFGCDGDCCADLFDCFCRVSVLMSDDTTLSFPASAPELPLAGGSSESPAVDTSDRKERVALSSPSVLSSNSSSSSPLDDLLRNLSINSTRAPVHCASFSLETNGCLNIPNSTRWDAESTYAHIMAGRDASVRPPIARVAPVLILNTHK